MNKLRLLPIALAISATNILADDTQPLFEQYCTECHNFESFSGGFELEGMGATEIADNPEVGEKIIKRLRSGLMPPAGEPRPDTDVADQMAEAVADAIDSRSTVHLKAPGIHRLNRSEYSNAVRDLLDVQFDATKYLPADDSSHGFDNIASALSSSPALMEAYLSAAGKISRLALGIDTDPTLAVFDAPPDTSQNEHVAGLPFGTRGGLLINYQFPSDGEYVFTVKGMTGYFTRVLGNVKGEQLEVTVDGERVYLFDWDEEIGNKEAAGGKTPPIYVTGGQHSVGVTFIATSDLPDTGLNKSFVRTMNSPGAISGYTFYPHVGQVFVEGPFNGVRTVDSSSRRKVFTCYPISTSAEQQCAEQIATNLITKAYRRPATQADVDIVMQFYERGYESNGGFEAGIQSAIQRILTDTEFVFRAEVGEGTYTITDIELASRLSFFLWSSIPDEELLSLAEQNKLSDPAVLEQQVQRMLADTKSYAFVENFTGQWLNLRGMSAKEPVVELFPDFDSTLREAFETELELFVNSMIQEDRSITEMLDANYTFLNGRLAKHYGIRGVSGGQFRRVELAPEHAIRRGLLGKGALLTLTSEGNRTSPVKRGKWFLETFYGVTPPDPPPGVETDLEAKEGEGPTTLRARLEEHRANPSCAACHKLFEPMGIAMENYDAVGVFRTTDSGIPVDPTGETPDGFYLSGIDSLRELSLLKQDMFAETVIEKMITYALGRGIETEDMPLLREIAHEAKQHNYKFSSVIMGIITHPVFTVNET